MSGDRVGPFVLERRLGAGGMGVVYQARDTRLGRLVALKLLSAESTPDPIAHQRLMAPLRSDPRFPRLLARMGLEP